MPAVPAIALALTAGGLAYGAVQQNQQIQHAKGAAEAQKTQMDAQLKKAEETDAAAKSAKTAKASATQAAALAALKASMNSTNLMSGSILTGGTGAPPAATSQKTLLGA